jgi:hypothetical protein
MLVCQIIPALVAAVKRFDSVLLHFRSSVLRVVSRARVGNEDLQET